MKIIMSIAVVMTSSKTASTTISSRPSFPRSTSRQLWGGGSNKASGSSSTEAADTATTCDSAFLSCILSSACRTCFTTLQDKGIDWTNVVPTTPCEDILGLLTSSGHCSEVRGGGQDQMDTFCNAFDTCVVWGEDAGSEQGTTTDGSKDGSKAQNSTLDCSKLTTCDWPGKHDSFIGDGVCHENMPGCYNSPICKYDGGDCCEDTCKFPVGSSASTSSNTLPNNNNNNNNNQQSGEKTTNVYGQCGMEGYACRNPSATTCQPALAATYKEFCTNTIDTAGKSAEETEVLPLCSSSDTMYRLLLFDSWGDGWDKTILTFKHVGSAASIFQGGLTYGSEGTVHVCLSKTPTCYSITVENGQWGNEVSWEIRPLSAGAPALGAGGSPADCTLPIGGDKVDCPNTCNKEKPDTKINDPNYRTYKDMENCINEKCLIQVGNCENDGSCKGCMAAEIPQYCYANDNFSVSVTIDCYCSVFIHLTQLFTPPTHSSFSHLLFRERYLDIYKTLVDCSMCSCSEDRPKFCDAKNSANSDGGSSAATHAGLIQPTSSNMETHSASGSSICGPEQTLKGTNALVQFSTCTEVDLLMAMVTDFDNDNFGSLDLFEECAHTYGETPLHGGKSALDCMKILHNLIEEDQTNDDKSQQQTYKPQKNAKGENLPENISKVTGFVLVVCLKILSQI